MYTVLQLAEDLGMTKGAIRRYLTKDFREKHCQVDSAGLIIIRQSGRSAIIEKSRKYASRCADDIPKSANVSGYYRSRKEKVSGEYAQVSGQVSTLIELLQSQLSVKDEQIRELSARLAEATTALVAAQQTAQTAQQLHAGTMGQMLLDGQADAVPDGIPKKKRWWRFGREG
ncbi:MAG TPA: hypothetical protein DEQ14_02950 [Treponema sp.]|nr:hypothetical protein [Treponema sp.]